MFLIFPNSFCFRWSRHLTHLYYHRGTALYSLETVPLLLCPLEGNRERRPALTHTLTIPCRALSRLWAMGRFHGSTPPTHLSCTWDATRRYIRIPNTMVGRSKWRNWLIQSRLLNFFIFSVPNPTQPPNVSPRFVNDSASGQITPQLPPRPAVRSAGLTYGTMFQYPNTTTTWTLQRKKIQTPMYYAYYQVYSLAVAAEIAKNESFPIESFVYDKYYCYKTVATQKMVIPLLIWR